MPRAKAQSPNIQYTSLPDLLEEGVAAFSSGNYPAAANAFNLIRTEYSEEPEWIETQLPQKLLPLAGFAAQKSGQFADSIAALETYLLDYSNPDTSNDFVLYTLATSYLKNGNIQSALEIFQRLTEESTNPSLSGIAAIQLAQLLPNNKALELLQNALAAKLTPRVATQTRLALIRIAIEANNLGKASTQLLNTTWSEAQMPELATLSFLAFELGDLLLPTHPNQALQAYRMVTPRQQLVLKQKLRLIQLENTYRDRAQNLPAELNIWADFYQQIILSLRHQLTVLESTENYQPAIDLRKAQCLSKLGRNMEAWLLLENLSLARHPTLSERAHKEWFALAKTMQAWAASGIIAQRYIETYPNSEYIDETLYWIGQAQLEQTQFTPATKTFDLLANSTTKKTLAASAHYLSGYALFMANNPQEAIARFTLSAKTAPRKPIAAQATLWSGIVHFSLENWPAAEATFQQVLENPTSTRLHPEAAYRLATTHYANDEIETAKTQIDRWITTYPNHARHSEALLLQGDILSSLGNYTAAATSYRSVSSEERDLRFYAIANLSEILPDKKLLPLLEQYAQAEIPLPHIGSFHELWHTLTQEKTILENAIETYGSNKSAEGITDLIQILYQNQFAKLETLAANTPPTLSARYRLALAKTQNTFDSETNHLRLVSEYDMQDLSPSCLAAAGLVLIQLKSTEAEPYFNRIIETYPFSEHIETAYYGLAKQAHAKEKSQEALTLLSHCQFETNDPEPGAFKAALLTQLNRHSEAIEIYQAQLANRNQSPRQKAQTLFNLGTALQATKQLNPAYATYQRIFTLYRGEPDLVAQSYYQCAQILATQNKPTQAQAVCTELLSQANLANQPAYQKAELLHQELRKKQTTDDTNTH